MARLFLGVHSRSKCRLWPWTPDPLGRPRVQARRKEHRCVRRGVGMTWQGYSPLRGTVTAAQRLWTIGLGLRSHAFSLHRYTEGQASVHGMPGIGRRHIMTNLQPVGPNLELDSEWGSFRGPCWRSMQPRQDARADRWIRPRLAGTPRLPPDSFGRTSGTGRNLDESASSV